VRRFVILLLSVVFSISAFGAEDHLKRGEWPWDKEFLRYQKEVRRILSRGWGEDVVLRTIHLPPFHPEWIVGVLHRPTGYYAFLVEPSAQIWAALDAQAEKGELAKIRPRYYERQLTSALADNIAAIFRNVLSDRRNYRTDRRILTDSSSFVFMLRYRPDDHLAASSASDENTKSDILCDVSSSLYLFVRGKIDITDKKWLRMNAKESQLALERSVQRAEAKLGVHRRSNQALEPTAGRCEIHI
jgi:hypothetical protein